MAALFLLSFPEKKNESATLWAFPDVTGFGNNVAYVAWKRGCNLMVYLPLSLRVTLSKYIFMYRSYSDIVNHFHKCISQNANFLI